MKFNVITLFPEAFIKNGELVGGLGVGIIKKAFNKIWSLNIDNLKQYSTPYNKIDERPVSGGAGMILKPDMLEKAVEKYVNSKMYFVSPRGKPLTQEVVKELSKMEEITFISGRYETIDQRIIDYYNIEEISIGDYVLCGGELPIQVIMESVIRLLPGVMYNEESAHNESFSNILLEYDQYTKPLEWKNLMVPEILLSGHQKKIEMWQLYNSVEVTFKQRKDLYDIFLCWIMRFVVIVYMNKSNMRTRIKNYFKNVVI